MAELLAAAPRTKALVTSRAVLRLSGEHDYPVPPLPLPDPDGDLEALAHNGAVTLFVARAQAVRPGFRLEGHARAVAEICRAVDGLPLALELAAARVKLLAPEALLDRLGRRLSLLDRGPADLPGRQRTLRAAIDWSYDLLDEVERALFARLAVFAGGCTVEAAEAVCGADLDALTSLVDKSLLRERGDDRFGMLETLPEYAGERLEASGEAEVLRKRHAEHFLALAIASASELTGGEAATWMRRLESEHDNLRAALAWAGAGGHTELELRLAAALQRFWRTRGHVTEARRALESALARGESASPSVRALALTAAADFADRQGERGVAREYLERALELFREAGDARAEARTLSELGGVVALEGDYARAIELFEQTMPLFQAAGDTRAYIVTVSNLASVTSLSGDHERARALNEEALELARAADDRDQMTISLHNLGRALVGQGQFREAAGFLAESIEISLELGYRELLANCLQAFGELSASCGEPERAARLLGLRRRCWNSSAFRSGLRSARATSAPCGRSRASSATRRSDHSGPKARLSRSARR